MLICYSNLSRIRHFDTSPLLDNMIWKHFLPFSWSSFSKLIFEEQFVILRKSDLYDGNVMPCFLSGMWVYCGNTYFYQFLLIWLIYFYDISFLFFLYKHQQLGNLMKYFKDSRFSSSLAFLQYLVSSGDITSVSNSNLT